MPCFGVPRRGWKSQMLSKHLPVTEFAWPFILVLQSSRYWQYILGTAEHKYTAQPFSWQNGWATGEMAREWKKLPPPNLNSKFGGLPVCVGAGKCSWNLDFLYGFCHCQKQTQHLSCCSKCKYLAMLSLATQCSGACLQILYGKRIHGSNWRKISILGLEAFNSSFALILHSFVGYYMKYCLPKLNTKRDNLF